MASFLTSGRGRLSPARLSRLFRRLGLRARFARPSPRVPRSRPPVVPSVTELLPSRDGPILTVSTETITYLVLQLPHGSIKPRSIEMDRGASTPTNDRFFWAVNRGMAHGYNQNPVAEPGGTVPARHLGAEVYEYETTALTNLFQITVEPMWNMTMPFKTARIAQRVTLANTVAGQTYPSPDQAVDRVIKFQVRGWNGNYVNLRLIDPPDDAPYAPRDARGAPAGWPATNPAHRPAVLPYEANDNEAWRGWDGVSPLDFGLTWDPQGQTGLTLSANMVRIFTPPATNQTGTLTYYLKVPARYAGDNWQVEVTRVDPKTGQTIPNQTPELSQVFTGWKRTFTERDHMFRRGGVIYAPDDTHMTIPAGSSSLQVYKGPSGAQLDNLTVGDKIAVFDASRPFEGPHDEAYVGSIDRTTSMDYAIIGLVTARTGGTTYTTQYAYTASPIITATHYPDFSKGSSAGIGVINSNDGLVYDTSPYQINGTGSAFYDADMRGIAQPYTDAFAEFIGLSSGMGAVPYLPESWLRYSSDTEKRLFHQAWFANKNPMSPPNQEFNNPHNYFHLIGTGLYRDLGDTVLNGASYVQSDISYVCTGSIEVQCALRTPQCSTQQAANHVEETTDHELAHQFNVNGCDPKNHDLNNAWCGGAGGSCANATFSSEYCIMHEFNATYSLEMRIDGIARMDCDDLDAMGPGCGIPACAGGISVRTDTDPE